MSTALPSDELVMLVEDTGDAFFRALHVPSGITTIHLPVPDVDANPKAWEPYWEEKDCEHLLPGDDIPVASGMRGQMLERIYDRVPVPDWYRGPPVFQRRVKAR